MSNKKQALNFYKKSLNTVNEKELTDLINKVVFIYHQHKKLVNSKVDKQDFKDVNGLDFNEWAYDTLHDIKAIYNDMNSKLSGIVFNKKGFSIIDLN